MRGERRTTEKTGEKKNKDRRVKKEIGVVGLRRGRKEEKKRRQKK